MKLAIMLGCTALLNVMSGAHLALTGNVVDFAHQMKGRIGDYCQRARHPTQLTSNALLLSS